MIKKLVCRMREKDVSAVKKVWLCFLPTGVAGAAFGAAVWSILSNWVFRGWDWLIVFMGYPVLTLWMITLVQAYRLNLKDGKQN